MLASPSPVVTIGTPPDSTLNASFSSVKDDSNSVRRRMIGSSSDYQGPSSPIGHAPSRIDTDEDLMLRQVLWEIDRDELVSVGPNRLGVGAIGEVIKMKWRGTPVAVKKLNVSGRDSLHELRHEIAVMSHMHHPRVVQFLGACTRSHPWLVIFEYLPGGALSSILERRNGKLLPMNLQGRWALDCAQGVCYLHEHKPVEVIHRDLKPNNVVIDASGHCKITDFGLALLPNPNLRLTGEAGSYRYMAPEVFRHETYSRKVDIYSLGMIIYYLTHGVPPFEDYLPFEAARLAAEENLRPTIRKNINPALKKLIEDCWSPDPDARPSAAQVCVVLESVFPPQEDNNTVLESLLDAPVEDSWKQKLSVAGWTKKIAGSISRAFTDSSHSHSKSDDRPDQRN